MPLPCRAGEGETLKKCTFGACAGAVCARRCAWTVRLQNLSISATRCHTDDSTSDQARLPAEFKHITKRRKRN